MEDVVDETNEIDWGALRAVRGRTWERKVRSDPSLTPAEVRWYCDLTPWEALTASRELGYAGKARVKSLSMSRTQLGRATAHPSAWPERWWPRGFVPAGVVRRWAVLRGSHRMDPATGKLTLDRIVNHGKPRSRV
jgi:hypothetical protein